MGISTRKSKARRLIAAANELLAIANELERGESAAAEDEPEEAGPSPLLRHDAVMFGELALNLYRDRRRRGRIFGDEALFGEPAWDLLLDLFIAAKEGKRVPVTSACIGAAVPTTTALRWISLLEERGLIVRENDASDARRVFVRLSADAYAKMVRYFAESRRAIGLIEPGTEGALVREVG
ncbi:MAG: MarR family transcriptional regulator [Novosphingobium sp.]|nr:MarR family transcriptional regulator [Novosphingobium sp.]